MKRTVLAMLVLGSIVTFTSCGGDDEPEIPNEDNKEIAEQESTKSAWSILVKRNWNYSCDAWDNMFPEKWQWIKANEDNLKRYIDNGWGYTYEWEYILNDKSYGEVEQMASTLINWSIGWTKPTSSGNAIWQYDVFTVSATNMDTERSYSFIKEVGLDEFPYPE